MCENLLHQRIGVNQSLRKSRAIPFRVPQISRRCIPFRHFPSMHLRDLAITAGVVSEKDSLTVKSTRVNINFQKDRRRSQSLA